MSYTDPDTIPFTTSQVVTAAELNTATNDQFAAMFPDNAVSADLDPTWGTDGSGFAVADADGASWRVGPVMHIWARARVSTPGTGNYYIELPVAAAGLTSTTHVAGICWVEDDSAASNNRTGVLLIASGSPEQFHLWVDGGRVSATYPFTMATNDRLSIYACYPTA